MTGLSHLTEDGAVHMVDVGDKPRTKRQAIAAGEISVTEAALQAVRDGTARKGDVLAVARIAGIMAAKQTASIIPLCHPLPLSKVEIAIDTGDGKIDVRATVRTTGQTGVEMEALTAVSATLLTIYDMLKSLGHEMEIGRIRLISKTGGKSDRHAG